MITLLFLYACSTPTDDTAADTGDDTAADTGDDTGSDVEPVCTEPTEVECVDELISDLSLHDDKKSKGDVTNAQDGDDWLTALDASAGGYGNSSKNAYTYVRFTDEGLEKLDITDEEALLSMDWDLAARRFIVRVNSGSSGPSCVGAAVMGQGYTYEDLTEVPDGLSYQFDDFYTDDCTLINDSSGLPGNPQVVLAPWWDYQTCVVTTDQPFLLQLADGRIVKLRIETYYANDGQAECNESGSTAEEGGYLTLRWRFMD